MSNSKPLIEGQDYEIRTVPFPNNSADGALMSHPDIPLIIINGNVCEKRQKDALRHELEHLANDDLYSDDPAEIIEGRMND